MKNKLNIRFLLPVFIVYLMVPIFYLILANFPERAFYKEAISILVIGTFFLILAQFYLSRVNKELVQQNKMSNIIKSHKIIGYIIIPILLIHPFLIVIPKFFQSGNTPMEAFKIMITTYSSNGIVLGLIAWIILVILCVTSLFRKKIPIKYTTWRVFHGILAIIFVILSTIHAVNLGRHTDSNLSFYMILLAISGILLLIKIYIFKSKMRIKK